MDIEQEYEEEDMRAGRAKRYLWRILSGLVIVAVIAGVLWLISLERAASAPIRTSDSFVNALLSNDVETAYALTNQDFRDKTSKDQLAETAQIASKGLDKSSLKVRAGEIQETQRGKLATVFYDLEGNNQKFELEVTLLKEQDKGWLVVTANNETKE
jgi:hypothetical protein